jgi:hypothetical protein
MEKGIREVEAIYGDDKLVRRRVDSGFQLLETHFQQPANPTKEDGVVVYVVGRTMAAKEARAAANKKKKSSKKSSKKKTTKAS